MPADLDSLLERVEIPQKGADSLEGDRLRRIVRARLLDETVAETRVDRFVVTERLGVGGMGVVYAAYDPELDRRVAIKLVRHWNTDDREHDQARLVREARALAQLSHPNVVAIYDVGIHDRRVFVAMELVHGTTLRGWLDEVARPWDEVLRCLVQAGEGLAAAHAVGIVHRDFKPENVLVAPDATPTQFRARVVDFGLASGDGTPSTGHALAVDAMVSPSITATGKVVGTPAYMAPEQFAGAAADPRTDQFSFCVAFWEALFGERPYPATTTPQLRLMFEEGVIAKPRAPERAPEWLRAVLVRGLAIDPDARWPSMRALLAACTPKPRRRKLWRYASAIALCSAALGFGGWALWQSHERTACARDADDGFALWNASTASAIVDAFAATGLAHARDSAERASGLLDDYAQTWVQTHERGCLAHLGTAIDDDAWQLRRACLDDRRERVATLLELLQNPDVDVVDIAVRVAYELPLTADCEDDPRLAANAALLGHAVDPDRVAELRRDIARAELLAEAGRAESIAFAREVLERARALGTAELVAEAELAVGTAHLRAGEYQPAADAYEDAYFVAQPLDADEVALFAATQLVDVVGSRLARFDDGLAWARHAEGRLPHSGSARPWREAQLAENVAGVLSGKGDFEGARASYERTIALRSEFAGPDHPAVGRAWASLGSMLASRRDVDGATRALDEAERILVPAFGRESLQFATIEGARGGIALHRGQPDEAAQHYEHVRVIREALLGPDHPTVTICLANLAIARDMSGDHEEARRLYVRVVDRQRRKLGPLHPALATALNNLGVVDTHIPDFTAAIEHLGEALQIRRTVLPPNHSDTAATLVNLGDVFFVTHAYARALASYDEAARMTESDDLSIAREHGRALTGRGLSRLALGAFVQARDDLEAAAASPYGEVTEPGERCQLHHGLARALNETRGDRDRIRELARTAHDECTATGPDGAPFLAELAAWAAK